MKTNVLPLALNVTCRASSGPCERPADVIDFAVYRRKARRLRLSTGVYFISRVLETPEDFSAA